MLTLSFRMNIDRKMKEKILLQGARLPYHFAEAGGLPPTYRDADGKR